MTSPFISVIVTTYNRRNFLVEALHSLINQTYPRENYEVIVVKNFSDEISNKLIKEQKFKEINCAANNQGLMYKLALQESEGRILCFLDDDDLFKKDKLNRIAARFSLDNGLHYLASQVSTIDGNGRIIALEHKKYNKSLYIKSPLKQLKELKFFDQRYLWANSSSVAIRKEVLDKHTDYLPKINAAIDRFLFLCPVIDNLSCAYDPLPLSYYRIHSENSSVFDVSQSKTSDYFRRITHYNMQVSNVELIFIHMLGKTPLQNKEKKRYYYYRLRYLMFADHMKKEKSACMVRYVLLSYIDKDNPNIFILFGVLLSLISPDS